MQLCEILIIRQFQNCYISRSSHRDAEVLKDRDLSGELKDIWGAVQAKRLREKDAAPSYENYLATQNQIYIDFGPESAYQSPTNDQHNAANNANSQLISVLNVDEVCGPTTNAIVQAENLTNIGLTAAASKSSAMPTTVNVEIVCEKELPTSPTDDTSNNATKANGVDAAAVAAAAAAAADTHNSNNSHSHGTAKSIKSTAVSVPKKDKLAAFLPNGCHNIFPFIKTKTSHDKNSNKDKSEHSTTAHSGTRKSCSNKDNKYIQNNTAHLESELSKIDLGK